MSHGRQCLILYFNREHMYIPGFRFWLLQASGCFQHWTLVNKHFHSPIPIILISIITWYIDLPFCPGGLISWYLFGRIGCSQSKLDHKEHTSTRKNLPEKHFYQGNWTETSSTLTHVKFGSQAFLLPTIR